MNFQLERFLTNATSTKFDRFRLRVKHGIVDLYIFVKE